MTTPATNPLTDFVAKLDDSTLYRVVKGVPVFGAHTRQNVQPGGKKSWTVVTDDDLEDIADATNAAETKGMVGVIVEGHRIPGYQVPESEQPDVLGYSRNARVGPHPLTGEPTILQDFYFLADRYETAKRYPYWSAEYNPARKELLGVGLLIQPPFLPLGTICYSASGAIMPDDTMPDDAMPPAEPDGDETAAAPGGDFAAQLAAYAASPEGAWINYAMQCYADSQAQAGGAGAPGGSPPNAGNAAIPAPIGDDTATTNYQASTVERDTLRKQVTQLQEANRRLECTALIGKLRGVKHDPKKELKTLMPLSAAERLEHVNYALATYQPLEADVVQAALSEGCFIATYQGSVETAPGNRTTEAQAKAAARRAIDKKIDYDAALAEIKAGKA